MRAQHFPQRLVHQVGGAVVAHGLRAALHVHLGDEAVAHVDAAFDDAAVVAEHVGLDLDGVFHQHARGGVAQLAGVAHLAAALGVERRLVEHNHGVVAGGGRGHRAAVHVDADDLHRLQHQLLVAVELRGRAAVAQALRHLELARFAGALLLLFEQRVEARLVDAHAALAADVAGEVDREAEGVVQLERGLAVDLLRAGGQRGLEDLHAVGDGLEEALFFLLQHLGDARLGLAQLGVGIAHLGGQRRDELVEERRARAQLVAVADRAARDAAQHVAAARVARDHAVDDGERAGADVVGDDLERRRVLVAVDAAGGVHRLLGRGQQRHEQVDLVVAVHVLQHRGQALQAHAGVDAGLGQLVHHAVFGAVELHEDVVPDLDVAVAVLFGRARRAARDLGAVVVEDLGARAARAGVAHHPEVVRGVARTLVVADADDAFGRHAHGLVPDVVGLVVLGIDGDPQLVGR